MLIRPPTNTVPALFKELCQARVRPSIHGLVSPILTPFLSEKTPRSIDTWEPDEVPVCITPTTLLFLYLRPQQTRLNKSLPVWPDYSELSTFKTPRRLARGSHSQRQCSAQENPHGPGGALEYTRSSLSNLLSATATSRRSTTRVKL